MAMGMDFTFKIDVDRWQRDLRTKKFRLLKRFKERLNKFNKYLQLLSMQYAPVDTGKLKSAIKTRVMQDDETKGVFTFEIYVDEKIAPHARFHQFGRRRGPAPPDVIRAWVERKLNITGKQAFFVTRAILKKLINVGFDGNVAPNMFFFQAVENFEANYLKRLLYELDLDVKEVWKT